MENLFGLLTLLPLPFWIAMLLFPRTNLTRRLVTSSWPFIAFGAVYSLLLLVALASRGVGDIGLSATALQSSIAGGWGFLAVWSHILILDLFAGIWIFRDARYWGV